MGGVPGARTTPGRTIARPQGEGVPSLPTRTNIRRPTSNACGPDYRATVAHGVAISMNATARDLSGETLDGTIAHEPLTTVGPEGPAGAPTMPNTTPQGQHRYTFGSGARPLDGYTIKRAIGRGGFG